MNILLKTIFIICITFQISSANQSFFLEEGITCPDSIIVNTIQQAPAYTTFQEFLDAGGNHSITSPVDSTFKLVSETSDGKFCPEHRYREYSIQDEQGLFYTCTQVIKVIGYEVDLSTSFVVNGLTVEATASASDGTIGYEWDFGDGTFSNDANAVHTYDSAGIYTICCSATTICDFENVCQVVNVGVEVFEMTDISTYYYCDEAINTNYTFKQYLEFGGSTTSIADTASFKYISSGDTTFISTNLGCTQQVPLSYTMKDLYGQLDTATVMLNLLDTIGIQGSDLNDILSCDADTLVPFTSIAEYTSAGGKYTQHCGLSETPTLTMIAEKIINDNCPKKIERTYELFACSRDTIIHTIEYVDTIAPSIQIDDITVQYKENVPVIPSTYTDFTNQGGQASDNCQLNIDSFGVKEQDNGSVPLIYTREFTIEDICGNTSVIKQTITVTEPLSTEEFQNTQFSLFPNPGHSILNIDNPIGEEFEVFIYSIDGKKVLSRTSKNARIRINTKSWNSGVYMIRLQSNSQSLTKKWMKN